MKYYLFVLITFLSSLAYAGSPPPEPVAPPADSAFCGTVKYNTKTQDCITCMGQNIVVPKGSKCCANGQPYNGQYQDCIQCGSQWQVVAKGDLCCSGLVYDHSCFRCENGQIVDKCPPGHRCCFGNCGLHKMECQEIKTVTTCAGSNTTTTTFECKSKFVPPPCQTTGNLVYSQGVCIGGSVITICYTGPVLPPCPPSWPPK